MPKSRGGLFGKSARVAIGALLLAALWHPAAQAAATSLTVSWDPNTEPDLAGYQIAYGLAPGNHPTIVDVHNVTSYVVTGLLTGTPYYFVVQAYDQSGNMSTPSAEVSGVPGAAPALTLSATDSPDPVSAGSTITYTLNYGNGGILGATSVVLTDGVPANTTFVSATAGGALSGGTVTWNLGALAAGSSGSVQMVVRVASPLANGTTITHGSFGISCLETALVSGAPITTTVTSAPVLTLSAADSPDPVNAGANLTYTLSYSNTGNMNASGTAITDAVPANTTFVSATSGGTVSAGTVSWNIGALNAGASGSVQMVVKVASPLANGTTLTNGTMSIDSTQTNPVSGAAVATTVASAPVLAVSASDSPDPVAAGGTLTYTLSYSNTGNANATGVVITDAVPANTTFVSATGGGSESAGTVTWNFGPLNAGASGSVQMTVRVASPLANGTTITDATYAVSSAQTSAASGPAVATTVTSAPVLALAAADAPDPVAAGANLTYTLSYSNGGNADAASVVITDAVPANTTFVSATAGGTLAAGTVTWNLATLAAGGSGSVQMVVKVASPLANGTTIANGTLTIRSAQTASVNGTAASTTVTSAPVLAVSGSDAPDPVSAGTNLTYTLSYTNTGNANATATTITDAIPANTTYVSSSPAGTLAAGTVTWSLGTLAAGAGGSVTLTVHVVSPLLNGTLLTNAGPTIGSAEISPVTGTPITTTVGSAPSLGLTVTDSPDPVVAGANLTYTIAYTNTGNANASGVVLTAVVPPNTSFVSATGAGTLSAGTVTWNLTALNAGASGTVQLVLKVASPLANGTTITSGAVAIACLETATVNAAMVTTTVSSAPVLSIAAADSPDPVAAGSNLTYTLTWSNTGNADATGVVISDTLPANTTFVSATAGGVQNAGVVTWSPGTLPAGGSGQAQMVVRVTSPLNNGTVLTHGTYSIDSAQTAPVAGAAVTTTVSSAPIAAVAATDSPDPVNAGSNITYTLSYSNTGNMNATSTVITDVVPAGTTFVSASNGGALSAGTVTWSIGTLAAGASGSVTLTVKVNAPIADGATITDATYGIDTAQTTPASGAAVSTTVHSAPALSLSMTDSPDPVAAGSNLVYTLSYGNTGTMSATAVVLTAAVPANTTFVSASAPGTLSAGTVTWSLGTLAAGATGTATLTLKVASPLANGTVITSGASAIDCAETAPLSAAAITTTVASSPALSLSIADAPNPVAAGASLTYTLSYANNGNATATGIVLIDPVPASTAFVSATGGGAPSAGTVTWNLGTLAAGASGSVQLVVQVASPLANGTTLVNGGSSIDCAETAPVSGANATTTVSSSPVLTVLAADAPDPVAAGADLGYTLTYANGGNAVATGTPVTATVPANTTFVSATAGGVLAGSTVTWSLGQLTTGASGSVAFVVRVLSPLPNGTTIALSTYGIDCNQSAAVAGPPIGTTVTSAPILALAATGGPNPVLAGDDITYTLTYSNSGNAPASGVTVTASVPAGATFVSASGGAVPVAGVVTWNVGGINGGGASGSVQLVVQVPSGTAAGAVITAGGFGLRSNETAPVTAPDVSVSVTQPSAPIVSSAVETVTRSIFFVQGATQTVEVNGSSFEDGAALNLSPDITAGTTTLVSAKQVTASLSVSGAAALGPRTLTLTNPDGMAGSLPNALQVVKNPDSDGDCRIDGIDLNRMARAWNTTTGDADYNAAVDLDGDGYVGPDDLAIFIKYFAEKPSGCP